MTAPNHAITGALIGLIISNPLIALPLAVASHFVLDILPHYDVSGDTHESRIGSRQFFWVQIVGGGILCVALVVLLAIARPMHWLNAIICAFLATLPDVLFIPRYLHVKRTGHDNVERFWFWKFHNNIQWFQRPIGIVVEVAWLASFGYLFLQKL